MKTPFARLHRSEEKNTGHVDQGPVFLRTIHNHDTHNERPGGHRKVGWRVSWEYQGGQCGLLQTADVQRR